LIINGGRPLNGSVEIEGSKNSVLPILAATVLNSGVNIIHKCPKIHDVKLMLRVLEYIGCKINNEGNTLIIDSSTANKTEIPEVFASEMRSSIIFLGPVLARFGKVTISYPGGCVLLLALFYTETSKLE